MKCTPRGQEAQHSHSPCHFTASIWLSGLQAAHKSSPCTGCFLLQQVKAELQKQWSRFLLADPFGCKLCFLGENIKYLRKCSQKRKKQHLSSKQHLCLEASEPWAVQLQQVLVQRRTELSPEPGCAPPSRPRASMSDSSEGEVTTGETTEEVFEESEI